MADFEMTLNEHHPQYEEWRKLFVRGKHFTVDSELFPSLINPRSMVCVYKRKQRFGDTLVKFNLPETHSPIDAG